LRWLLDDVAAQTAKKDRNGPPTREVRHQPQPIDNHLNVRLELAERAVTTVRTANGADGRSRSASGGCRWLPAAARQLATAEPN
jgi:hypothetical protein